MHVRWRRKIAPLLRSFLCNFSLGGNDVMSQKVLEKTWQIGRTETCVSTSSHFSHLYWKLNSNFPITLTFKSYTIERLATHSSMDVTSDLTTKENSKCHLVRSVQVNLLMTCDERPRVACKSWSSSMVP